MYNIALEIDPLDFNSYINKGTQLNYIGIALHNLD